MKNLDQLRAGHAIASSKAPIPGTEGGEVVKKVPALIRQNGLLPALAFACEKKGKKDEWKNEGHHKVFEFVVSHLRQCPMVRSSDPVADEDSVLTYNRWLTEQSSAELRVHTAEIMAYLGYLRRYVRKGE